MLGVAGPLQESKLSGPGTNPIPWRPEALVEIGSMLRGAQDMLDVAVAGIRVVEEVR